MSYFPFFLTVFALFANVALMIAGIIALDDVSYVTHRGGFSRLLTFTNDLRNYNYNWTLAVVSALLMYAIDSFVRAHSSAWLVFSESSLSMAPH